MDVLLLSVYILTNICIAIGGMTPKTIIISSETSRWIHQSETEQGKATLDSTPSGFFSSIFVIETASSAWSSSSSLSSSLSLLTTSSTSTHQILPSKSTTYQHQSSADESQSVFQTAGETSNYELRTSIDDSSVYVSSRETSRYELKTSIDDSSLYHSSEETSNYALQTSIVDSSVQHSSEETTNYELKTSIDSSSIFYSSDDSSSIHQSSEETNTYELNTFKDDSSSVLHSFKETSKIELQTFNDDTSSVFQSSEETTNNELKTSADDSAPVSFSSEQRNQYELRTSLADSSFFQPSKEKGHYGLETSIVNRSPDFNEETARQSEKNPNVESSLDFQSSVLSNKETSRYRQESSTVGSSNLVQSSSSDNQSIANYRQGSSYFDKSVVSQNPFSTNETSSTYLQEMPNVEVTTSVLSPNNGNSNEVSLKHYFEISPTSRTTDIPSSNPTLETYDASENFLNGVLSSVLLQLSTSSELSMEKSTDGISKMGNTFTPASLKTLSNLEIPTIVAYSGNTNTGTTVQKHSLSGGSSKRDDLSTEHSNLASSTERIAAESSTIAKSSSISGIDILMASNFSASEIAHWFESGDDRTNPVSTDSNTLHELTSDIRSQDSNTPSDSSLLTENVVTSVDSSEYLRPSDTYSTIESESADYIVFEDETFHNYDDIPSIDTFRFSSVTQEIISVEQSSYKAKDSSHFASSRTTGFSSIDEVNMEYSRLQAFTYPSYPRETDSTKSLEASPSAMSNLVSEVSAGRIPKKTTMSIKPTSMFDYEEITETTYRILSIPELLRLHQISQQSMATESQFLEPTLTSHPDPLTQQTISEEFSVNEAEAAVSPSEPSSGLESYESSYLKHDWSDFESAESRLSTSNLMQSLTEYSGSSSEVQNLRDSSQVTDRISESIIVSNGVSALVADTMYSTNSEIRETSSIDSHFSSTTTLIGPMTSTNVQSDSSSSHYETSSQSSSKAILQAPSISINVRTKSSRNKTSSPIITSSASLKSTDSKLDAIDTSQHWSSLPSTSETDVYKEDNSSTINSSFDGKSTSLITLGSTASTQTFVRENMSPSETRIELVSTDTLAVSNGDGTYTSNSSWRTDTVTRSSSNHNSMSSFSNFHLTTEQNIQSSIDKTSSRFSVQMSISSTNLASSQIESLGETESILDTTERNYFDTSSQPPATATNFGKDSASSVSAFGSGFINTRSPLPSLDLDSNELSISEEDFSDSDMNMGSLQNVEDASDLMKVYSSLSSPSLYTMSLSALREHSQMARHTFTTWLPEIQATNSRIQESIDASTILSEHSMLEETPALSTSRFTLTSELWKPSISFEPYVNSDVISSSVPSSKSTETSLSLAVEQSSPKLETHQLSERMISMLSDASTPIVFHSTDSPVDVFPTKTADSQLATQVSSSESLLKSMEIMTAEESSRSVGSTEIQGSGSYSTHKGSLFDLSSTFSIPKTITADAKSESHMTSLSNIISEKSLTQALSQESIIDIASTISLTSSTVTIISSATTFTSASIADSYQITTTVTSPIDITATSTATPTATATATVIPPGDEDSTSSDYILKWVFTTTDGVDITSEDFIAKIIKGLKTTYEIGYNRQHTRRRRSIDGIDVTVHKTQPVGDDQVEIQFSVSRDGNLVQASEAAVTFGQVSTEELEEITGVQTFGDLGIAPLETVLSTKPEFTENIDHILQTGNTQKPSSSSSSRDKNQAEMTDSVSRSTLIQEPTLESSINEPSPTPDFASDTSIMTTSDALLSSSKDILHLTATQGFSSLSEGLSEGLSSNSGRVDARGSTNGFGRTRLFTILPTLSLSRYDRMTQTIDMQSSYVTVSSPVSVDQTSSDDKSEPVTPAIPSPSISSTYSLIAMSSKSDAFVSDTQMDYESTPTPPVFTSSLFDSQFNLSPVASEFGTELQTMSDADASTVMQFSQILSSSEDMFQNPSTESLADQQSSHYKTASQTPEMISPSSVPSDPSSSYDTNSSETPIYPDMTYKPSLITSPLFDSQQTTSPQISDLSMKQQTVSLSDTEYLTMNGSSMALSSLEYISKSPSTESLYFRTRVSQLPLMTVSQSLTPQLFTSTISDYSKDLETTSPSDLIDDYSSFSLREGIFETLSSEYPSDLSSSNLSPTHVRSREPLSPTLDPSSLNNIMDILSSAMSVKQNTTNSDIQASSTVIDNTSSITALPDETSVTVMSIPVLPLASSMDTHLETVLDSVTLSNDVTYQTEWLRTRVATLESTITISGSDISQEQTPSIYETVLSELITRMPYITEVSATVSEYTGLMSQGSSELPLASEVVDSLRGTARNMSSVFRSAASSVDAGTRNTEYSVESLTLDSVYFDSSEILSSQQASFSVSTSSEVSTSSSSLFIGYNPSSSLWDSVLFTSLPSYPNMISIPSKEYNSDSYSRLPSQDAIIVSDSTDQMESSTTLPLLMTSAMISSIVSSEPDISLMTSVPNIQTSASVSSYMTVSSVTDDFISSVIETNFESFQTYSSLFDTQTLLGPTFTDIVSESYQDTIVSSPSILLPSGPFDSYTSLDTISPSSTDNAFIVTSYTISTQETFVKPNTESTFGSASSSPESPSLQSVLSSYTNVLDTQYALSTKELPSEETSERYTESSSLIIPISPSVLTTVVPEETTMLTSPQIVPVYQSESSTVSSLESATYSPSKSVFTTVSDAVYPTRTVTMSSSEGVMPNATQSTTAPATQQPAVPSTEAPVGPPESALMLLTMNIELGVNISSPAFILQLESDLTQLFQIALSERSKRDTRRYRRQENVNAEVVKSERDTESAEQVTTTFAVQEEGGYVEADLAVPVFNRITQEQSSIILSQQVLGPIRAAVDSPPSTRPNTNLLILVAVLIPAVLLVVGVLFIVAQMRRRKRRANAVGDLPPRYQRGDTLEDHNLTVDVEKGEIVDKTPTSTPSLHPRASHTERKVPLMGGVSAPGVGDSDGEGDKTRYPEDVTLVEGEKGSHRSLILKEKELLEKLGVHNSKTPSETSDDLTLEIPKRSKSKKLKSGGASEYSTVGSECPLIPSSASMTTVSSIDSDVHTDASDEFTVIIRNNQSPEMKEKRPKPSSPEKENLTSVQRAVPPSPGQTSVSDVKSSSTASPTSDKTSPSSDQASSSDLQTTSSGSTLGSAPSTKASSPSTQTSLPTTEATSPLNQSSTGVQTSELITPHLPLTSTGVQASDLVKPIPLTSVGVQASSAAPSTETRSVDTQTSKGSSVTSGSDLSSPDEKIESLPVVTGKGVPPDTECKMVQTPWKAKRRTDPRDIYIDDDDLQDPNSPVNTRLSISAGPGETANFLFPVPDSITQAYNRAISKGRRGSSSRSSERLTDPDSPSISSVDSDSDPSVSSGRLSLEEDSLEDMLGPLQMAQQSEVAASWSRKNSGQSYKYSIGDEDETPRYMFPNQSVVLAQGPVPQTLVHQRHPVPQSLVHQRHPVPQPRPRSSLTRRGAMAAQIEEEAIAEEEEAVRRTEDTTKRAQELLQQSHALAAPDLQSLSPSDMMERIREELKRSEIPVPGPKGVVIPKGEHKSPTSKSDTSGSICSGSSGDSGGASTDSTAALLERVRGELQRIDSKEVVKPPKPPRARSRKKEKHPKS